MDAEAAPSNGSVEGFRSDETPMRAVKMMIFHNSHALCLRALQRWRAVCMTLVLTSLSHDAQTHAPQNR
jgi:hypothetical protein